MSNSNLVYLLLTAYQSSIHSSHIASLRGALVIGWPTATCSFGLLHLLDFHQATEKSRFPTQRCPWKGKCSKVSHLTPCRTCSRFYFLRAITNRQSEQLLRPGFWSSNLLCTSDLLEGCKTSISILRSSKVRRRNAGSNGSKAQTHCRSEQMLLIHMDSFWLKLDPVMMS